MGLVTKHSTTDYCRAPLQVARLRTGAKDQRPRCDTRVHAPALCTSTERQRDDLRRPLVFENRRLLLPTMKSALCGSARCGAKRCAPPRRARHAAAEGVPHPPRIPLDTPRVDSSLWRFAARSRTGLQSRGTWRGGGGVGSPSGRRTRRRRGGAQRGGGGGGDPAVVTGATARPANSSAGTWSRRRGESYLSCWPGEKKNPQSRSIE